MIGKTISHYRILNQIGEGGMGVVYVAEDTLLGRLVAVKIPHAGRDESHYRARFLREARAVSRLRHPNVAAVHDFGETDDGQPFIVMELVTGQTLGDILAGPGISIARAVEVARETADALAEAHHRGVVHRDIKPSNVIIDDRGEVKVLDFGLAKQLHEEVAGPPGGGPAAQAPPSAHTRSDVVIGTPLYLSPEQARGAKVDGRSDLFALGALLYECVAGRPAFSGANVIEIGAQVLHFDPPPPSRFNPRVPPELDRLVLKALAKRPEDRFQTAGEFAAELERVRTRLPDSDTTRTRRLTTAENGHRSSAFTTMAEGLRRPKFSALALVASLAALLMVVLLVRYVSRPTPHDPGPEVAKLYAQAVDEMRQGAYYKASGLLTRAVELDHEYVLAHARLAEAQVEMDFIDRAKDEMLTIKRLAPDFSIFPREDALYLEAVEAIVNREPAGAVRSRREVVRLKPARPQAHLDLGRAYERNYELEAAVRSYNEATKLDPSYAAAHLRLGMLHVRQKNTSGATAALDRAQKLYAESGNKEGEAAVRYQRGWLFANLKRAAEARAELTQALQLARETDNKYQQVMALQQLALAEDDGAAAERTARQALDLAQASGMNDQVANAYITLANVHYGKLSELEAAAELYEQALNYARNYKLRRYEAVALFNLGSLRTKQSRADEAERYNASAREFFLQAGYRRDADQCAVLVARNRRQKTDYEGALAILREQLRLAEQAGDMGQVGALHRECGAVYFAQEKYPQALEHFNQGAAAGRSLHNVQLLSYSLLNQASTLWPLGRYEEAAQLLGQLTGADPQTLGVGKDVLAYVYFAEAEMELSRRNFGAAADQARKALAVVKEMTKPPNDLRSLIESSLGVALTFSGSRAEGLRLCEGGLRLALDGKDPRTISQVNYALALALLEAGDHARALAAALSARETFARMGQGDSEWRSLAVAGRASRRGGDETAAREYLDRAAASLSQFEQSLGAEAASYLSRPDVRWLRSEFGSSAAAH